MMAAALAGANMIYGPGMVEQGMTMDYGLLVADNEFIRMVKRMLVGVPVNKNTLAVDLIREVGIGGEFVTHRHTFDNFRENQAQSALADRNTRGVWLSEGGLDMHSRCNEEARKILATHQPLPLSRQTARDLRQIIALGGKEFASRRT